MERIVYTKSYKAPQINKKEILRYCRTKESDELNVLIDECIDEADKFLSYRVCYAVYPVSVDNDIVDLGFCRINSHSLSLCLKDCDEIVLFCATVGPQIDRLIKKYSISSPVRAVLFQAIGSERVESLCDDFCADVEKKMSKKCRPRFSPGYGDLPLEFQKTVFSCLEPSRIGVSLSSEFFMTPSKTVTAIIGLQKEK